LDWNTIKVILTQSIHLDLLITSFKMKIQSWKYDKKKHQNNNYDYGNKAFPKIQTYLFHTPLKLHVLEWYNGLSSRSLLQNYYLKKKSPMLYSNSNGDKNYVI